jgi:hypothetical protein
MSFHKIIVKAKATELSEIKHSTGMRSIQEGTNTHGYVKTETKLEEIRYGTRSCYGYSLFSG